MRSRPGPLTIARTSGIASALRANPLHASRPRDQRSLFPRSGIFAVERWTSIRQVTWLRTPNETTQHDQRNQTHRQQRRESPASGEHV